MGEVRGRQHGCHRRDIIRSQYTRNAWWSLGPPFSIALQLWLSGILTNELETSSLQASSEDQRTPFTLAYAEHLLYPPQLETSLQDGTNRT